MPDPKQMKRTKLLVDRAFQFRFARFVMAFAFGTALFACVTVFFTTFSLLGEKLAQVYPQGRLVQVFRTAYIAFGIDLLLTTPVIYYVSIRFSHRIVGPLPKIYTVLRKIGQGDFDQKVVLRKHDELRELAAVINEMADNLRARKSQGPQS